MRNRFLLMILLLAIFCACEKENNDSIPELLDDNPKVLQISVPSLSLLGTSGYCNIVIKYQGELISSITRPGDSILFYYTNEQLDSARRYSTPRSISDGSEFLDENTVSFIKKNGKIIQANFKSINFANDTLRFHFIYNSDKLAAVKSPNSVDTLIYKNGQITDIRTYSLIGGGFVSEYYGELFKSLNIKDYIDRPNPYYLISNRLGFPYFSCVWDNAFGAREDYTMECRSNYVTEDIHLGIITGKLNYDYDDMGRIKAIYSSNHPDRKTSIQYQ